MVYSSSLNKDIWKTELYHFEVILTNNGCLGHLAPSRTLCYPHLEDNRTKENTKKVHYIFIICQKSWKPNLLLRGLGECSECQIMTLGISAKEENMILSFQKIWSDSSLSHHWGGNMTDESQKYER